MQQYYWDLNLIDYPNLGVDFPITKFIFALLILICLGEIHFAFEKRLLHRLLRRLLNRNAIGKGNAKTLEELSFSNDKRVLRLIASGSGRLCRQFEIYGLKKPTPEEFMEAEKLRKKEHRKKGKDDLSSVRLAIDPTREKEIRSYLFRNPQSAWRTLLTCLLTVSIGLCIVFFLPSILDLFNLLVGHLAG